MGKCFKLIPSLKLTFSPLKMVVSKFGISWLPGVWPFSGANLAMKIATYGKGPRRLGIPPQGGEK